MSASAQALYFHLGMHGDDDGFVSSPRKIARIAGCNDDDLRLLAAKGYIIPFESGVVVITDWNINNTLKNDRYHPTIYAEEKSMLTTDHAGRLMLGNSQETTWNHDGTILEPERNLTELNLTKLNKGDIVDPSYRKVTLADDDGANPKISKICRKYVDQWDKVSTENIGILFRGPVGTGKSFFACCIANELLKKRVPTAVTSFPRLLNLLQNSKDRQGLLDRLSTYKLLVIDDLGVERDTGYAAEQIFAVIDARCRSNLPTIVTTNLTPQEMDAPETMQYKRIFDRVTEMCPVSLLVDGESRRIQNAQRRKEIARELLL